MAIDNRWYDDLGDRWWDTSGPVSVLHELHQAHFDYFKSVIGRLSGLRVLDVGCGGGILAEAFARAGAFVTGMDLSHPSLVVARRHSLGSGLSLDLAASRAEALPFIGSYFDCVVSADLLEHVPDPDPVIAEAARVLKPGGLFLYDTINRTLKARVAAIWLLERVLNLIPPRTHDYHLFIKPGELRAVMERHGIANLDTRGLSPEAGPLRALAGLVGRGSAGPFRLTGDTSITYVGFGVKVE